MRSPRLNIPAILPPLPREIFPPLPLGEGPGVRASEQEATASGARGWTEGKSRHEPTQNPPLNKGGLSGPHGAANPRAAYTLMELLLAMAILLAVAGIAWPTLQAQFSRHRLKNQVETVRVELAGTRYRAIDSGLIYQFLFEPGGVNFVVVPYEGLETEQEQAVSAPLYRYAGRLDEGFWFEHAEEYETLGNETAFAGALSGDFLAGLPNSFELQQVAWSTPILFYPDGSATTAGFDVRDSHNQLVRLTVRDLTGAVSVDPIRQETR